MHDICNGYSLHNYNGYSYTANKNYHNKLQKNSSTTKSQLIIVKLNLFELT